MKKSNHSIRLTGILMIFVLISYVGCVSTAYFDQYAYTQTISLKVDGLNLMDLAKDNFNTHQVIVKEYQTKLLKVYEYEKNRPKNDFTTKLWDKLLDSNGHLLGGFLNRWEKEKKLNETFINEEKKLVSEAFDQIARLESGKNKSSSK